MRRVNSRMAVSIVITWEPFTPLRWIQFPDPSSTYVYETFYNIYLYNKAGHFTEVYLRWYGYPGHRLPNVFRFQYAYQWRNIRPHFIFPSPFYPHLYRYIHYVLDMCSAMWYKTKSYSMTAHWLTLWYATCLCKFYFHERWCRTLAFHLNGGDHKWIIMWPFAKLNETMIYGH